MRENSLVFLSHILESITFIEKYTESFSKTQFLKNTQLQDAVIRRLEIIGEAVKNLSENVKRKNPDIPWKKIAGTRDILIHEYFSTDFDLLWNVIKKELPKLKKEIQELTENF